MSKKKATPPAWPADAVERRSVKSLLAYPRNARTHSPEQVEQIVASMREFGWTTPLLIDEQGMIICGHGRLDAANKLGISEVPVMVAAGWTEAQKRAYRLADNQIPMNAGWDNELLRLELTDLKLENFDLELICFDDLQLVTFMAGGPSAADPEAVPEPPPTPVTKRGDLWLLGNHRLLCGDATSESDVAMCLGGAKPHLMVTDPPYGVEYDPMWRDESGINRFGPAVARGAVSNDDRVNWTKAWEMFAGDVAYVWHGARHAVEVAENLAEAKFEVRAQIIWAKQNFALSRGDYHWQHEPCWYVVRKGKTAHWAGDRKQVTLWEVNSINPVGGGGRGDDAKVGHGTQKPIECMKRPIENNSRPGDAVYEPFSGSFTTGIACEMTQRKCYALEISEAYVDLGILRWQEFSGKEAVLDGTDLTYAEVKKQRASAPRKYRRGARASVQPA